MSSGMQPFIAEEKDKEKQAFEKTTEIHREKAKAEDNFQKALKVRMTKVTYQGWHKIYKNGFIF